MKHPNKPRSQSKILGNVEMLRDLPPNSATADREALLLNIEAMCRVENAINLYSKSTAKAEKVIIKLVQAQVVFAVIQLIVAVQTSTTSAILSGRFTETSINGVITFGLLFQVLFIVFGLGFLWSANK